jgi:3-hydroxyisobutyrate dehydrogenase-like beta-hydroxyacid dehydrogenase
MRVNDDVSTMQVGLIGYGEVGKIFAKALVDRGVAKVSAFDILLDDPARRTELTAAAERDGVGLAASAAELGHHADLVISAVTARETRNAAAAVAAALRTGAHFLDLNSASPQTKADCGTLVAAAGGRYVEAAVMNSVPPYGIRVPMLLGGPDAAGFAPTLAALGFAATVVSNSLGVASAIKMCRSVIIKGMEAIVIESFLSARKYGVEEHVLASLAETFPGMDWERNGTYFFSRVVQHGRRRAEEMREAAVTVGEAGLEPLMAAATAGRQAWVAELARTGTFAGLSSSSAAWRDYADAVLKRDK